MLPVILGLETTALTAREREIIDRLQPAGYILFSRNIESVDQTRHLTDELRGRSTGFQPVIAIDQEGGRVIRTASLGLQLPGAADLAALGDIATIVETAIVSALSLSQLGFNTNFAPVLDLGTTSPQANALPSRCWGTDPQQVLAYAGIFNRNQRHYGLMTCGKHFPGMGKAETDPHSDLPVIHSTLEQFIAEDIIPFMALDDELSGVMLAHILLPAIDPENPASLSPALIGHILRERLDYRGLVYTDDLCMGAIAKTLPPHISVPRALEAGCDLPLVCHHVMDIIDGIAEGIARICPQTMHDTLRRIERNLHKACTPPTFSPKQWEQLLWRADGLYRKVPSAGSAPSSPVQQY